jgi:hypothetical protein
MAVESARSVFPLKPGQEKQFLFMFAGVYGWLVYKHYAEGKHEGALWLAACGLILCAFIVTLFFATGRWQLPWNAASLLGGEPMTLNRAYLILVVAFAWVIGLSLLGSFLVQTFHAPVLSLLIPIAFIGFILMFLAGLAVWAGAKGYSPSIGIVLGLVGPLGMLVMFLLPDRTTDSPRDDR